jgi:signal transduction histidine kinase
VSSSLPAGRRGSRFPLRVTLVALVVGLVSVALLATGLTATSLLRGYLTEQQDAQLRLTADRLSEQRVTLLRQCTLGAPTYPATDYLACLAPGGAELVVLAGPTADAERRPDLGRLAARIADADDGGAPGRPPRMFTVPAEDRSSSWRVAAVDLPQGYTGLLARDLRGDEQAIGRLVAIEVVVGLVVLVLLGAAGYVLVGNRLRPLTEVEDTARAIAAGDLSRRVPTGDERTEVGRLSTALNGMLGRIESAFQSQQASEEQARGSEQRMRRFVADASHELRTPLTSIRGFAELYRQGAARSEQDVARLMQRIEAEGGRMGLLVEDLLLLARMDQQRPLAMAPVDLAAVAGDAVHDARAVQPDRPISLHLDESLIDVPVVLGDESRLRQVVGNLVTNALTHTPVDVRVLVSVAQAPDDPDVLLLRVADEGPGMDEADAGRAFERFYRADTSRTRAAGGTGLGLAIVASLASAHGGSAALETAPGAGLAVTVRLPRGGAAPPA